MSASTETNARSELPRVLAPIVAAVQRRNVRRRSRVSVEALAERLASEARTPRRAAFVQALSRATRRGGVPALIAECKRRSPSAGVLVRDEDVGDRARAYVRGGAAALSILTERDHFAGARAHLVRATRAGVPVLRKDFVIDEGMVVESAAMGAHAVLLIVRCLAPRELARLVQCAHTLGLAALVEVHGSAELAPALDSGCDAIGVNARDLDTLAIDVDAAFELLAHVPNDVVRVAESGLFTYTDLCRAAEAGADAVLVGTALLRQADPERAVCELLGDQELRS